MKISYNDLVFKIIPFLTSYNSNTKLYDIVNSLKDWADAANNTFVDCGVMPDFHFHAYENKDSYVRQQPLFDCETLKKLKELGLIDVY